MTESGGPDIPDELEALQQMRRLEFIADVALSHVGLGEMLDELLERLRETLGVDTVAILLRDEDDVLVPRAAKGLEDWTGTATEGPAHIPWGRGFAGRIAAERRAVWIPDVAQADIVNPKLRESGVVSLLGVPLIFHGRVIGVLHVGSLHSREFTREEEKLLEQAASRVAPAIEHGRLYDAESAARREAQEALAELRALQAITDVVIGRTGLEDLLNEILTRVRETLQVDTAAILILDEESDELVARAAQGIEGEVERGVRVPVGRGFAGRIAAERRVVALPDFDSAEVVNPLLSERGIRSLLGAPMMVGGQVVGVMHVGMLTRHEFSDADGRLLERAAHRIGLALDRDRLVREYDVALTMQRNLLPDRLPELPGVALSARYRPSPNLAIGGDWYDALPLSDGRIGIAIGDVVSRGMRAANVMVQVRSALRTYVLDGGGPAEVLNRLARAVRELERREMVTLMYGEIDPIHHRLVLASAGHPPPLLVEDGRARFVDDARGAPLGTLANPRYQQVTIDLEPGALLVLYTDGLVERRDLTLDDGQRQLVSVVGAEPAMPDEVCERVMSSLISDDVTDDVALLAARVVEFQPERLELRLPAIGTSLTAMRRALRAWLEKNGATEDEIIDIVVAVGEAAGNAVEHAYGPGDAEYEVVASVDDRTVLIVIRDFGNWRPPRGQNRGRGTMLMGQLMDELEVAPTDHGTEVRMRRRLHAMEPA